MELFNSSGKIITKSDVILLTKSIGSVIVSSTVDVNNMLTEQIKIEVEKESGNLEITKGSMSLQDFILLTTFNADAVTSDANYKTTAECEIAENGAIELGQKDVIKISLSGLVSSETYVLNGIEMPQSSSQTLEFVNKSMSSDDKDKNFDVHPCDLALIDNSDEISEVAYTYLNDVTVKYTLHELRVLSRTVDPVGYVQQNGNVSSSFPAKLQLPLFGVKTINIRKSQGSIVNLLLRLEA
jgi:hypothetical protein